jgi:SAM-dependent methyltransferase
VIPDFLGGNVAKAEAILRWPSGTVAGFEPSLLELRRGRTVPAGAAAALAREGLVDGAGMLTRLGDEIAYNLAEFRRQEQEAAFGGMATQAPVGPGARVLDVGCGAGQSLARMAPLVFEECVGVDVSPEALALGRRQFEDQGGDWPILFVRASGHALPFESDRFTHVTCRVGLNYMKQRCAIAEMARVLAPGGSLHCRVEGPGFDLELLRKAGSPRERLSRLLDLALGLAHEFSGHQPEPGGRSRGGRAFATARRLTRFLAAAGCDLVQVRTGPRSVLGLPEAIEVLARKRVGATATGSVCPETSGPEAKV